MIVGKMMVKVIKMMQNDGAGENDVVRKVSDGFCAWRRLRSIAARHLLLFSPFLLAVASWSPQRAVCENDAMKS